jgi:hypothetical protein
MSLQPTFRSGLGKDARQYIAHKKSLGRSFDGAIRVLAQLDGFLSWTGSTQRQDLTAETFTKWSQSLGHVSPNTRLARMRVVLKFCIYRQRCTPGCFVPDPTQFPKRCPLFRPFIFSESDVAQVLGHCRKQREQASCSISIALGEHAAVDYLALCHGHTPW